MTKLLSKNIIIYGGTNALKSLVPLLLLPILTLHLTISEFGILSLIETTILFVTPLILLNSNAAINVEYFKVEHSILKNYITNALLISFISFLFFILLVYIFKDTFSNSAFLITALSISSLTSILLYLVFVYKAS